MSAEAEPGGIDNTGTSKVTLGSTIVSGNTSTDLLGDFKSLGYNVIGSTLGATITGVNVNNLTNAAAAPLNLGALASYGGATSDATDWRGQRRHWCGQLHVHDWDDARHHRPTWLSAKAFLRHRRIRELTAFFNPGSGLNLPLPAKAPCQSLTRWQRPFLIASAT